MNATAQGSAKPTFKEVRRQRRELRTNIELAQLAREKKLHESLTVFGDGLGNLINLYDRFRDDGGSWIPMAGSRQDRVHGTNFPFFRTEQELAFLRAPARIICGTNSYAQALLSGLTSYVVGPGYTYRVTDQEAKGASTKAGLIKTTQRYVDNFLAANEYDLLEQELYPRSREDGEFYLRHFWDESEGVCAVRTTEPEQIHQPDNTDMREWSFGHRNPIDPVDVQKVLEYHVVSQDAVDNPGEDEFVDAGDMLHCKINTRRSIKRGVTDFCFSTYESLDSANRLKRNIAEGAAIQAAVAEIVQYTEYSMAQVTAMTSAQVDYSKTNPLTSKQTNYQRMEPGTRRHIPRGMSYVPPPGASNVPGYCEALAAALRAAGMKHNAPEWLVTGEYQAGALNSALQIGTPFVIGIERQQGFYGKTFVKSIKIAIRMGIENGVLPAEAATLEILAEPRAIAMRDRLKEAQTDQIYVGMGAKSIPQVCQEQGNDYEQTQLEREETIERFGPPGGLPLPGDDDPTPEKEVKPPASPFPQSDKPITDKPVKEAWDPTQHPRGQPENAGEFGSGGGGAKLATADAGADAEHHNRVVAALKTAGASVAHIEHAAKTWAADKIGAAVALLPAKLQKAVHATFYAGKVTTAAAFATWKSGQALAEKVAMERGASPEQARKLRGVLSGLDITTFKPITIGLHATGMHAATLGTLSFIPPATASYLAYSTARNPLATLRAAKNLASETGRKVKGKFMHESIDGTDQVSALAAALQAHGWNDWYVALLSARLDNGDDLAQAIDQADRLYLETPECPEDAKPVAEALDVPDFRQTGDSDCGAAALRSVAAYFGHAGTETDFVTQLGTTEAGTSPHAIVDMIRGLGLHAETHTRMAIADLAAGLLAGGLCICPIQADAADGSDGGHYVVVCGYNADTARLTLQDPLRGRVTIAESDFLKRWHDVGSDGAVYDRFGIGVWR